MSEASLLRSVTPLEGEARARPLRVDRLSRQPLAERRALIDALTAASPSIAPKYFYDPLGCALFGAICELPEYYPTRTERAIFESHRAEIAMAAGRGRAFVDLGCGDCAKGEAWIDALAPSRYLAVDIAAVAVDDALRRLRARHPNVEFVGVLTDFTAGLDMRDLLDGPATFFYPGSSIGNFAPDEARAFLASIRAHCRAPGSGLLIGVDTPKDPARLVAAYDDALGVTAAFNRNVLHHVNAVLGTRFDPRAFAHEATWDAEASRVRMWLVSTEDQCVDVAGHRLSLPRGARIHTEDSYKHAPAAFATMLGAAGFPNVRCWQDRAGDFAVFHATP